MTASITCSFQFVIMANLISYGHQKMVDNQTTREGFLRKNIVAVSFFQNCAIHQYS